MSFLTSLGQYVAGVADSVAGLALSPRRAPPARHRSAEETHQPQPPQPSTATMRGFPRVVPTEGASALNARRRTLDCLGPAAPPRRGGSLRAPRQQPPPEKPSMAFCKRRLSWPEVDNSVNSGVQETDGSYFESFTALSWRQENRRLAALRLAEARAERPPPAPHELGLPSVSAQLSHKEHEHLYTEVLYCIENAVGAPAPDGQFAAYKEEVIEYARRAFRVSDDVHARALRAAGSERPPTVVLGCCVIEADGLEAKDANDNAFQNRLSYQLYIKVASRSQEGAAESHRVIAPSPPSPPSHPPLRLTFIRPGNDGKCSAFSTPPVRYRHLHSSGKDTCQHNYRHNVERRPLYLNNRNDFLLKEFKCKLCYCS